MHRFSWTLLLLVVVICGRCAFGQAPPAAPLPPGAPVSTDLGDGCFIDLPSNWVRASDLAAGGGFYERTGARLAAVFHPTGSRPTDLPYALVESFNVAANATRDDEKEFAEQIASYYSTALNPPSKADRTTGWKRATLTPIASDYGHRRFTFTAKIHYDVGGDYHVDVAGSFANATADVLSVWSDDTTQVKHDREIARLTSSLRSPGPPPARSIQEQLMLIAQVGGVLFVLMIVGVQAFVFMRDRRQRRAEESIFDAPTA